MVREFFFLERLRKSASMSRLLRNPNPETVNREKLGRLIVDPRSQIKIGELLIRLTREDRPDDLKRFLMEGWTRSFINYQDGQGLTALHHAAALGARSSVKLLVATQRCDYSLQDKFGRCASDIAVEWTEDRALARWLSILQFKQSRDPSFQKAKIKAQERTAMGLRRSNRVYLRGPTFKLQRILQNLFDSFD